MTSLLDDQNQWNEELIKVHFLPIDVEVILNISLGDGSLANELCWHFDKRENYSVKGGYKLTHTLKEALSPSTSDNKTDWWWFL
ncbi:hypothetical protein TorRG33x02_055400 [Trema orientale]|uniref:Uncharacterized protein n=1 Tax=Trema orientale TaxID=63057 RepID=A0A2P5FLF9_TREOI|nr:hypothetical protein TorRG33x02_055400 [Trema orientale]